MYRLTKETAKTLTVQGSEGQVHEFQVWNGDLLKTPSSNLPSVKKFAAFIEKNPDVLFIMNADHSFEYGNNRLLEVLGVSFEELKGKTFEDLGYPPDLARLHHAQLEQAMLGNIVKGQNSHVDAVGETHFYENTFMPLYSRGKVVSVGGITREITESVRLEEEKEKILYAIAHDLRSPLSVINAGAEILMEDGELKEEQKKTIRQILGNAEIIENLIVNLLDSAKLKTGASLELTPCPGNLREILNEVVDDLNIAYSGRVELLPSEGSAEYDGLWDRGALRRLIQNFVSNGVKYGGAGRVQVLLDKEGGMAKINVVNGGRPIDRKKLERIKAVCEGRSTPGTAYGTEKGWGIGLSVVRGIVEAHGGAIEVASGEDAGTSFCARLPIVRN